MNGTRKAGLFIGPIMILHNVIQADGWKSEEEAIASLVSVT